MLYLLDASVLITANGLYYPIDRVPEYWEWLAYMGSQGHVKMPFEIFEEVKDGPVDAEKDLLYAWLREDANKKALLLDESVDLGLVQKVIAEGYAADLSDDEIEQIGRDPFVIAYGLADTGRCVVTVEASRPKTQRQNRKIPDVCGAMGVNCCNPFAFTRDLGFRTQWKMDVKSQRVTRGAAATAHRPESHAAIGSIRFTCARLAAYARTARMSSRSKSA